MGFASRLLRIAGQVYQIILTGLVLLLVRLFRRIGEEKLRRDEKICVFLLLFEQQHLKCFHKLLKRIKLYDLLLRNTK